MLAQSIIAHQGGWDEALLVAGPIAVIFFVLRVAKRRADAFQRRTTSGINPPGDNIAGDAPVS